MQRFDIKIGSALAVLAIMVVPLIFWSASSDSGPKSDADLTVEWDPSKGGDPLLTVSIADD
jgi:hypothetical protein